MNGEPREDEVPASSPAPTPAPAPLRQEVDGYAAAADDLPEAVSVAAASPVPVPVPVPVLAPLISEENDAYHGAVSEWGRAGNLHPQEAPDPCLSGSMRAMNPVLKAAGIEAAMPHPLAKLGAVEVGRLMFLRRNCLLKVAPPCTVNAIDQTGTYAMDALSAGAASRSPPRRCV